MVFTESGGSKPARRAREAGQRARARGAGLLESTRRRETPVAHSAEVSLGRDRDRDRETNRSVQRLQPDASFHARISDNFNRVGRALLEKGGGEVAKWPGEARSAGRWALGAGKATEHRSVDAGDDTEGLEWIARCGKKHVAPGWTAPAARRASRLDAASSEFRFEALRRNRITCNGAASLSRGLKKQRCLSNGGRPVVGVLELDLSENAIGDDGFQALVEAVCDCMGDQRSMQQSVRFEASWGLEKLHLWHTDIQRPTDFLIHAFSLRMRLLVEAVDVLEKNEPLQRRLMEQRRRRPECFEVFGLGRDEHLEMMKEGMFLTVGNLQELWARLMAGADQREALKAASEAADPRVLQAAIEAAEACSLPEKDLLQPRQVLAELKMREEAGAALVKAAAGKDMEVLESAIAKAKASLVPDSASAEAEIKLQELRQVAECEAATAALHAALEAADEKALQAAVVKAEACSLPEKELLQPRQILGELKMREEAGAALVKAAAGSDMEVLESAIAKAKASLVPDSATAEAEIKLQELRQVAECEAATAALHAALEAADEKALQAAVVKAEACSLPEKELLQSRQVLAELKMREEAGAALVKAAAGNDMEEPEMPTPAESGVSTYAVSTCDMVDASMPRAG
ncbi:unnamed protein product [Effrenium voratum]|nr:unnamed protein product [Effrenium voratum]